MKVPSTKMAPQQIVIRAEQEGGSGLRFLRFIRKYILAPIPALIIVAGALLLIALGVKNIQIGGLLGALLGKSSSKKRVDVANTVSEDRVREDGTLIPKGELDSKGTIQAKVVPIKKPNLFDDPSKVKIQDPDTGQDIEVDVPDGVKAKDVDQVVILTPEIHAVTVKSTSKIKAKDVDDLLVRLGS